MESNSKDKDNVACLACGCELKRDHLGIKCPQGHHICPDCSKIYIQNMMSEPEVKIPAKCSLCNFDLNALMVEMHMDEDQKEIYLMYRAMTEINKDTEIVANCSFCKYFEIWMKTCTSNFFYCKKEGCKKVGCIVCNKQIVVSL
jgi:hypothetical protein